MSDGASIDYGGMMHDAMRGLIRRVLSGVAEGGLPGEHHFFITFDTRHPDVAIADWLRERYPEEMTIVLQHWFEDLSVEERQFTVTLNFGDQPEPLLIPFDALKTFVDPSVEFGLRFETRTDDETEARLAEEADAARDDGEEAPFEEAEEPRAGAGEVVSLDKFRKR